MTTPPSYDEQLKESVESDLVPKLYGNGFVISLGTGDVMLLLKRNEQPVAVINLSYTVAKTLVEKLGALVARLEQDTAHTIMTTDYVTEKLQERENV